MSTTCKTIIFCFCPGPVYFYDSKIMFSWSVVRDRISIVFSDVIFFVVTIHTCPFGCSCSKETRTGICVIAFVTPVPVTIVFDCTIRLRPDIFGIWFEPNTDVKSSGRSAHEGKGSSVLFSGVDRGEISSAWLTVCACRWPLPASIVKWNRTCW